ncbi:MAG: HD domain-containing protein [Lentisphaeria bacterium]|nr:HD domain-containing protein [Lentisphaeria bacterium]
MYKEDTPLRRLLFKHCCSVRDKALEILDTCGAIEIDRELVIAGAILHDIGVGRCHAPSILCVGDEPYIAHGIIGGEILREYGRLHGMDLEACARICERHTGAGLTRDNIVSQALPLPRRDFLPETPEEKLICLADKFFSKSGDMLEKSPEKARASLAKFGADTLARYDEMCSLFGLGR